MKFCSHIDGLKPVVLMVVVEAIYAGNHVLYKLAVYDGISIKIMIAYRFIFASVLMIPLAFFMERKTRPKMTWMISFQVFLCGIFGGSLGQTLYAESLSLTSATFVSAVSNLIPVMVFMLALIFGLEKLKIGTMAGKAKLMGFMVSISGGHQVKGNQGLGSFLAIASCLSLTIWYLIQAKVCKAYPPYSATALMCTFASIQATVFVLCAERDWSRWKLNWNIQLITILYAGILQSGFCFAAIAWCSEVKGAFFVSAFYPLMLVFVAIVGTLFLDEHLYLGSLIGSILIVVGLYAVLWGKSEEIKQMSARSKQLQTTEEMSVNSSNCDKEPQSIV
ncbi:WAT1-related protein At1g25270 isoform X2 [Ziziphus jujuba]|uniref:WAT1-related protein n=1 Tax=Ziziphus jujuba TaxID=326968 RepID=A0A6P4A660_ZIZJJ|nr:WAT1-related protein At1g25270 isoform X2 [Ziziphus jujuba]